MPMRQVRFFNKETGEIREFTVDSTRALFPPPPWTDRVQSHKRIWDAARNSVAPAVPKADPDQQEKSELVIAIENLGGKADRRHSVDNLRAQLQALVDAQAEPPVE
jgi:hypothetical protein